MTSRLGKSTAFILLALLSQGSVPLAFAEPFSKSPAVYRGSWNSYGETCDKASGRNYTQDRAVTALHRFYDKNKIPRPVYVPYFSDCPACNIPQEKGGPLPAAETAKIEKVFDSLQPYLGDGLIDDIKCIHAAQKEPYGEGGIPSKVSPKERRPFVDCTSAKSLRSYSRAQPPCATPAYLELLARTFRSASYCAGLKRSDVGPLIAHESSFYPSIRSSTGAAGLGQLTGIAIQEVKNQDEAVRNGTSRIPELGEIQKRIDSDSQCAIYKNLSIPKTVTASHKCELMAFPNQPFLSTLTALKIYVIHQNRVRDLFDAAIPKEWFSPEEREKILREATLYSYNAGTNVPSALFSFIKKRPKAKGGRLLSAEEILAAFPKRVASGGSKLAVSAGKRAEIAGYVRGERGVNVIAKQVEERKGGACFAD